MWIKKLSDVKAVQTLSRLNRTHKGKNNTFVLDFQNEAEDIRNAFSPYYEQTELVEEFEPNLIYDFYYKLKEFGVYLEEEVEDFNKLFFSSKGGKHTKRNLEIMNSTIDRAVERYKRLTEEEQEDFKTKAVKFTRLYNFVILVAGIEDVELHKLYVYFTYLVKKLPRKGHYDKVDIEDKVELAYLKLKKTLGGKSEGDSISLSPEDEKGKLMPPTFAGGGAKTEEEKEELEVIIERLNERFGTEFTETDALSLKQIQQDFASNEELMKQARVNTVDDFALSYKSEFMNIVVDRMSSNEKFFMKILSDETFKNAMMEHMLSGIYQALRQG